MEKNIKILLLAINIIAPVRKYQAITTPILPVWYRTTPIGDTTLIFYFSYRPTLQRRTPTTLEFDGCTYSGESPMSYTSFPDHCIATFDHACNAILVEKYNTDEPCQFRYGEGVSAVGK